MLANIYIPRSLITAPKYIPNFAWHKWYIVHYNLTVSNQVYENLGLEKVLPAFLSPLSKIRCP